VFIDKLMALMQLTVVDTLVTTCMPCDDQPLTVPLPQTELPQPWQACQLEVALLQDHTHD